ncbi:MAG: hypothetical protein C0478_08340 [Planctomyces sp.]|nr:hypothetical protein [Planctomyces sp.]
MTRPHPFASPNHPETGRMRWIGMDEAGLGPNLGPLVITATVWETPLDWWQPASRADAPASALAASKLFWESQQTAISRQPVRGDDRLHVADSKEVYSPAKGLSSLAASVHGLLALWQHHSEGSGGAAATPPSTIGSLIHALDETYHHRPAESREPWFAALEDVPLIGIGGETSATANLSTGARRWQQASAASSVRLQAIQSRVVFTPEFNQRIAATGNKSAAVSEIALELMKSTWQRAASRDTTPPPTVIISDQHGGRQKYDALLSHYFPDEWWTCLHQGDGGSHYLTPGSLLSFAPRSEIHLPVAAASLVCKYLRECCMEVMNKWWRERLPGIPPTKGYPQDAKRFREQILPVCHSQNLPETLWWRMK